MTYPGSFKGDLQLPYSFVLANEVENITRLAIPLLAAAIEESIEQGRGAAWVLESGVLERVVTQARRAYEEIVRQGREARE